jgi:hypothetical protein
MIEYHLHFPLQSFLLLFSFGTNENGCPIFVHNCPSTSVKIRHRCQSTKHEITNQKMSTAAVALGVDLVGGVNEIYLRT